MSTRKKAAKKPAVAKKANARTMKAEAPKKARKAAKATKTTTKVAAKAMKAPKATASAKKSKAAAAASLPNKPIGQKQSKSQIYAELADIAQISKSDVKSVVSAMRNIIERHVKVKGSGEVTIPDLGIKVRRVQKKATKARVGRNPFTGEEIRIPAKPARKSVKVSALKTLKALISE